MKLTSLSIKPILFATLVGVLAACTDPNGRHKPVPETQAGKSAGAMNAGVGYQDVKPIFAVRCATCHPSRNGPDWLDYQEAKRYAENGVLFRRIVSEKSMPPMGSPEAASITSAERDLIGRWASSGGPLRAIASAGGTGTLIDTSDVSSEGFEPDVLPAARQCLNCHGLEGPQAGGKLRIPRLAGQNSEYLFLQLQKFRWRDRIDPTNTMNEIAGEHEMDEATMRKISDYFAGRPRFGGAQVTELNETDKKLYDRGQAIARDACVQCHLNASYPRGTSDPGVPALAGQSEEYLRNQLIYFRDQERKSPLMHEYARGLSNVDIESLATYFSAVKHP